MSDSGEECKNLRHLGLSCWLPLALAFASVGCQGTISGEPDGASGSDASGGFGASTGTGASGTAASGAGSAKGTGASGTGAGGASGTGMGTGGKGGTGSGSNTSGAGGTPVQTPPPVGNPPVACNTAGPLMPRWVISR